MNTNYLKDFAPYEPSLALKELGFDEPCMCFYNNRKELKVYHNVDKDWNTLEHQLLGNSKITLPNTYSAPLYQQAFRWLYQKLEINGVMPLDEESQIILLKELIDRLSSN
jgi:hypothetical protein